MKFEIEIISDNAGTEIFELKDFLIKNDMRSFKVKLKEDVPVAGEMSIALTAAIVVGEKLLDMAVDKCFGVLLEDKVKAWLEKRNTNSNSNIEVVTSILSEKEKLHYVTNALGETKLIDQNFTLKASQTNAIIVGNGEFENNFPAIGPIKGNLEQVFKIFSDKRIFNIPKENIKVLLNKSNIEIEEELLKESKKSNVETLIIYFAGHGYRAGLDKLFLLAKNSRKIDDYIVGGIDFDFIKNVVLKNSTANNKIMILDACHSGVATQDIDKNVFVDNVSIKGSYILASSAADQVSYFNADHSSTYFTNEFINVFIKGRSNDKEWLSIDDVYETLNKNLFEKKLPLPHVKSDLTIPTSHFHIANNVQYDIKAIVERTKEILKEGKLEDALKAFNELHSKYPNNTEIKSLFENTKNELLFNTYVADGDEFLFLKKEYDNALKAYKNALLIKNEYSIVTKIEKCHKLINDNKSIGSKALESSSVKSPKQKLQNSNQVESISTIQDMSVSEPKVYNVTEEYPKTIGKKQTVFTYMAGCSVIILSIARITPIAPFIFLFLSPYAMLTGLRWWLLKIKFQGESIHRYDTKAQLNGKIIFFIGAVSWVLLIILFSIGISRLPKTN